MDIRLDESGPFTIAFLTGNFSASEAPAFLETLYGPASGAGAELMIDLAGVTSIDSSGLSAMVNLVTRARLTQGRVVLVSPPPFISGILNVTLLDQWFEVCESLECAEERLATE